MFKLILKISLILIIFNSFFFKYANSDIINEIEVKGNQRIPKETILMFSTISVSDDITTDKLNIILKELYETNYFEDVKVSIVDKRVSCEAAAVARAFDNNVMESSLDGSERASAIPL